MDGGTIIILAAGVSALGLIGWFYFRDENKPTFTLTETTQTAFTNTVNSAFFEAMNSPQNTEAKIDAEALKKAEALLRLREGYRLDVYLDSRGFPTVGIGHLIVPADNLKMGDTITAARAAQLFQQDVAVAFRTAKTQVKELNLYNSDFLAAYISVNFQLGNFKSTFPNTFTALKNRQWQRVYDGLLVKRYDGNGKPANWYAQTPKRVEDFVAAIKQQQARGN